MAVVYGEQGVSDTRAASLFYAASSPVFLQLQILSEELSKNFLKKGAYQRRLVG
jgi:hypothetical protein